MSTYQRPVTPRYYRTGSTYTGNHYGDNRYETKIDETTSLALIKLSKIAPELADVVKRILTDGFISRDVVTALEHSVQHINWDVATVINHAGENINWDVAQCLMSAGEKIKSGAEQIDASTRGLDGTIERALSSLNVTIERVSNLQAARSNPAERGTDVTPPLLENTTISLLGIGAGISIRDSRYSWKYRARLFLYRAKIFIYGAGGGFAIGAVLIYYVTNH
jgi:hypothetical protein